MPCAEERIHEDGHWDWTRYSHTCPERSELTVSKVQTYNLMKKYLGNLENTTMKTLEDLVRYNDENTGSEGGRKGTHPAFTTGQDLFRECVDTKGLEDKTYWNALKWTTDQCREKGIDAALKTEDGDFDGLLFCDVKLGGNLHCGTGRLPNHCSTCRARSRRDASGHHACAYEVGGGKAGEMGECD